MVTKNKSSEVVTIVGESDMAYLRKMTYAVIPFHGSISFVDLKIYFTSLHMFFVDKFRWIEFGEGN